MIQTDYHLHCRFSTDSETPPEEQALSEARKGIREICFTDHDDPGYSTGEFQLDYQSYFKGIADAREALKDRIRIHTGLELGLRPDFPAEIRAAARACPWEFIIGSTHVVDGYDPYYPEYWIGKTANEGMRRYYEYTLENIRTYDCFDVYGHLDYLVRYIPADRRADYDPSADRDIVDEILRTLIARGKGIECNTGGYRCGLGRPNPGIEILTRYRELGGTILTIGSDGHRPEHTALHFSDVPAILRAARFKEYTIFRDRKPVWISLDGDGANNPAE